MTQSQPGRPRALTCPSCGGSVTIKASGISISVVCGSCGSTLDVTNPDVRLLTEAQARTYDSPIPLGKRGSLDGTEWEVVGYQHREDVVHGWTWDEYLLFNPYQGFRFLVRDDEDWTYYCMLRQDVGDPEAGFEGRVYTLQNALTARTDYVSGEFYWRVKAGDQASVAEYVCGADVLSRERTDDEIIWSRGTHLPETAVSAAFGPFRQAEAPALAAAATKRRARAKGVVFVGVVSIVLLLLLFSIPFGENHSQVVFARSVRTTRLDKGQSLTSEGFTIPGAGGNLRITVGAPVANNWAELDLTLAGPNNTAFYAQAGIEYWHGVDTDGTAWVEGSRQTSVKFPAVLGGSYQLVVEPYAGVFDQEMSQPTHSNVRSVVDFNIVVTRHVESWGNFLLALLVLVPYPLFYYLFDRATRETPPVGRPLFGPPK